MKSLFKYNNSYFKKYNICYIIITLTMGVVAVRSKYHFL